MTYNPDSHAMLVRSDARALGAITAINTTYRRKPRSRTVALTPCVSNLKGVMGGRSGKRTTGQVSIEAPAIVLTHVRARTLKAGISTYLSVASRVGLDLANVANLYRQRVDNGYNGHYTTTTLTTNDLAERTI